LAHDAGVIAASLVAAGLAGQPDMGFAAAAAVAAAAAAVSEQQQQQQQSIRQQATADANSSSSSGQVTDGNGYAAMPPGYVTLQVRLLVFSYCWWGLGAWGLYGAKLALSACWLHACAGCSLRLCVCELTDSCMRCTRSFLQGP
jgi:hypothetical protein